MIHPEIPQLALSIMQPWSWLIVNGFKDIENRTWKTSNPGLKFRGQVAIHAGKKFDGEALADLSEGLHPVTGDRLPWLAAGSTVPSGLTDMFNAKLNGGIVGVAEIVDCVTESDSDWFVGRYGFVLRNARPVEFIPSTGALGFFDWRKVDATEKAKKLVREASDG